MDRLQQARQTIDRIDGELARLFGERMAAAAEIAARKRELGLPVRDPAREREVLEQAAARIDDPALCPRFAAVMNSIIAQSREYQMELLAENTGAGVNTGDGSPCSGTERTVPCALRYPIFLERGVIEKAASLLDLDRRVFLVTDDGVPAAYAQTLAAQCRAATVYTIPQGEASKSPETLTALLEAMLRAGLTRGDCVAAVGGGVVGDLAGLAAALYMRGIDWYNVPTTLLSMVDSSVGGKTAVDLGSVKNAVGAFWQPKAVLIDPDVLGSLPPRQCSNGLAEAVKMALTHDPALFARFEDPAGCGPMEEIIAACLRIKTAVAAADEREAGLRRVLNFGHTLGHGLEAAAGGRLLHGEAVALGMLPLCAPEVRARLRPVLDRLGLPISVNFELDVDKAIAAIAHDKKSVDDGIQIVTVPAVGQFSFRSVSLSDLRPLLQELSIAP
jgi:3-dehydroquinate synthase